MSPRSGSVKRKSAPKSKRPSQGDLNAQRFQKFVKNWTKNLADKVRKPCKDNQAACTITREDITAAKDKAAQDVAKTVPEKFVKVSEQEKQKRRESLVKSFDDYVQNGKGYNGKSVSDTIAGQVAVELTGRLKNRTVAVEPAKGGGPEKKEDLKDNKKPNPELVKAETDYYNANAKGLTISLLCDTDKVLKPDGSEFTEPCKKFKGFFQNINESYAKSATQKIFGYRKYNLDMTSAEANSNLTLIPNGVDENNNPAQKLGLADANATITDIKETKIEPTPKPTPKPVETPKTQESSASVYSMMRYRGVVDENGAKSPAYAAIPLEDRKLGASDLYLKAKGYCDAQAIKSANCAAYLPRANKVSDGYSEEKRAEYNVDLFVEYFKMNGIYGITEKELKK